MTWGKQQLTDDKLKEMYTAIYECAGKLVDAMSSGPNESEFPYDKFQEKHDKMRKEINDICKELDKHVTALNKLYKRY